MKNKNLKNRKDNYFYFKDQSLDSFEALLKKCPNITSIQMKDYSHYSDIINHIFSVIIENCNNLSEVIAMDYINDSNFEEFHRKFAPKIKYFFSPLRRLIDLNRFPNIEKIQIVNDDMLSLYDKSIIPQLKLAQLKKLKIDLDEDEEHMLKTFIDTFPTLTHLEVSINSDDENAIYNSLKNISNLKHLIHFKLHDEFGINYKQFFGLLKQMTNNCQNLKSIDFDFVFYNQNPDMRQFFSQLKAFPALKRLKLCLYYNTNNHEYNLNVNQLFSFDLFKDFSNITHLTLSFGLRGWSFCQLLKKFYFKKIEINLPKLQYLEIKDLIDTTPEGVKQMAEILSRLSRLETLKLKVKCGVDLNKKIKEQISKKCRKIREMKIKFSYYYSNSYSYFNTDFESDDDTDYEEKYEVPEDDNDFNYDYNYDYNLGYDFYLK